MGNRKKLEMVSGLLILSAAAFVVTESRADFKSFHTRDTFDECTGECSLQYLDSLDFHAVSTESGNYRSMSSYQLRSTYRQQLTNEPICDEQAAKNNYLVSALNIKKGVTNSNQALVASDYPAFILAKRGIEYGFENIATLLVHATQ